MTSYTLFATGMDEAQVSLFAASCREALEPLLKALNTSALKDPCTLFDIEETTPLDEIRKLTPEEQAQKEFDEAEDAAMIKEDLKWANGDDGIETEEDL